MNQRSIFCVLVGLALLVFAQTTLFAGGKKDAAPQAENPPVTILVAAAASREYSYVQELIPRFQKKYPWITVEGTYDSSGKLQTQIEQGLVPMCLCPRRPGR
jgi:molybdate transport system substrate-binding protein